MRKSLKRISIALLLLIFLLGAATYAVFRSSNVQTYIVQKVSEMVYDKWNIDVQIDGVDFHLFNTFEFEKVLVLDHKKDTLTYIPEFYIDLDKYDLKTLQFELDEIELFKPEFNLYTHQGDTLTNLDILLNKIPKSKSKDTSETVFQVILNELVIDNGRFRKSLKPPVQAHQPFNFDQLELTNITTEITGIVFNNASVKARLDGLSFNHTGGLNIQKLSGQFNLDSNGLSFQSINIITPQSNLQANLILEQIVMGSNVKSKENMSIHINNGTVYPNELACYFPKLEQMKQPVLISLSASTKRHRLRIKDIDISFESASHLVASIDIDDYTQISESFIYGTVKDLRTTKSDLNNIANAFPNILSKNELLKYNALKVISFDGSYSGFFSDFVAYGTFHTNLGDIKTDIELNTQSLNTTIEGNIETKGVRIGKLLNDPDLGVLQFTGQTKVKLSNNRNKFDFKGNVKRLEYKGYNYQNLSIDAGLVEKVFSGKFLIQDPNLDMRFVGSMDFSNERQKYDFDANINFAQLAKLGLIDRDSSLCISGQTKINLSGKNFEDLDGDVVIKHLEWDENGKTHYSEELNIHSVKTEDREMIALDSDWIRGKIEGNYNIAELYPSVFNVLARDMPGILNWRYSPQATSGNNQFRLMFVVKDFEPIQELFIPELVLPKGTVFSGKFDDHAQLIHLNLKTDSIVFNNQNIEGLSLYLHNKDSVLNLQVRTSFVEIIDSIGLEKLTLFAKAKNNNVSYDLAWDNSNRFKNKVSITGLFDLAKIDSIGHQITKSAIVYKDTTWSIDPKNKLVFYKKKTYFEDFIWTGGEQSFAILGNTSANKEDSLMIALDKFDFVNFSTFIDAFGLDITGRATGNIKLYSVLFQPYFDGDISINQFSFNKQKFGEVKLHAKYDPKQEKVYSKATIDNLSDMIEFNTFALEGDYYPFDDQRIDYDIEIKNLKVEFIQPYVEGLFSNLNRGKVSGGLSVVGNINTPQIDGVLRFDQLGFKVDYTNVKYTIDAQELIIKPQKFILKDFVVGHNTFKDSKATINGYVSHDNFRDFDIQLKSMELKEFIGLDTRIEHNSTYHGRAFVDGNLSIIGSPDEIDFSGTLTTVPYEDVLRSDQTILQLPLDKVDELEASDFIEFVNLSDSTQQQQLLDEDQIDLSGISLNLNFIVKENALAKIIFDPTVGEEIKVRGSGDINLNISSTGNFQMNGDYIISDGSYHFTLQNFISRKFFVEPGSSISWDGDPTKGNLDILTYYQTRSKLITLIDSNRVANYSELRNRFQGRIPVNTNLMLKGNMFSPTITMGVSLPQGSPEEKEIIDTYIIGDDETNRQAFGLLLTGQFLPQSNGLGGNVGRNAGIDNGVQFIEGQINNALGGIFNNVDLGFDYNTGDTLSAAELRLLVGFHYKSFTVSTDYDINNDVGDIQVELRITDDLSAKAFHKRTEQTVLDNGVNTIQGMGVVYEKSFDSFKEFLQRRKKKPKVKN